MHTPLRFLALACLGGGSVSAQPLFDVLTADYGGEFSATANLTYSGTPFVSVFGPSSANTDFGDPLINLGNAVGSFVTIGSLTSAGPGPIDADPATPLGVLTESTTPALTRFFGTGQFNPGLFTGVLFGIQSSLGLPSTPPTAGAGVGTESEALVARLAFELGTGGLTEEELILQFFLSNPSFGAPNPERNDNNAVVLTCDCPSNINQTGELIDPESPESFLAGNYRLAIRDVPGAFTVRANFNLAPVDVKVTEIYVERFGDSVSAFGGSAQPDIAPPVDFVGSTEPNESQSVGAFDFATFLNGLATECRFLADFSPQGAIGRGDDVFDQDDIVVYEQAFNAIREAKGL